MALSGTKNGEIASAERGVTSSRDLVEEIERNLETVQRRLDIDYDADVQAIAEEIQEIVSILVDTQMKLLKLISQEQKPG